MPADIQQLCERNAALKAERASYDSLCQELAEVISPRKAQITLREQSPGRERGARNSTAATCNMTLAQGCMAYAMPFSERWFALEPPPDVADDASFKWYGKCSELVLAGLAASNFYTEVHEACLDRSGFSVGNLYVEESMTLPGGLIFDAVPCGTYSIAENPEKLVDTVFREREMTAVQLVQEFGEERLPGRVMECFADASKRHSRKFTVVHAVYPREDRDTMKLDALNMGVASCWFLPDEKVLLREGGYESNPYLVSRYLKWGSSAYGWCPGWHALDPAKYLNRLEFLMDGVAEVQLYPRMLIPSTLEGVVGMGAGDVTIYNPFQNAKPEVWGTEGRIEAGLERLQRREQEIKDAYHYDLFRMFSQIRKQMTAREVAERATENLVLFSPTFLRMQWEWLEPMLQRVFSLYVRQRRFPEPPPGVVGNGGRVRPPRIQFTSRVALAIRSLQSSGFMNLLESLQPMMAIDPSVRHVVKVSQAARGLGRNFGVPEEWLSSEAEYEEAIQGEQQAAKQEAEVRNATQVVNSASKLRPEQIDAVAGALGGRGM